MNPDESNPDARPTRTSFEPTPEIDRLVSIVVEAAFQVHRQLGPGLMECVYERCVAWQLQQQGLEVQTQKPIDLVYKGLHLRNAFRVDLHVRSSEGHALIAELKATDHLPPVARAQTISYLRLLNLPIGLLINFNTPLLKDGVQRILNLHWQAGGNPASVDSQNFV